MVANSATALADKTSSARISETIYQPLNLTFSQLKPKGCITATHTLFDNSLNNVKPGDHIAYYSPTLELGSNKKLQVFTVIGIVKAGEPYQFDMGDGFCPFRRDVSWLHANESPIRPILDVLEFSAGNRNWGYQLRFGIFQISDHDIKVIAVEMNAELRM